MKLPAGEWRMVAACILCAAALAWTAEAPLDGCDEVGPWRPVGGQPAPRVAGVASAREGAGQALRFTFFESAKAHFAGRALHATEDWDRAAGLSFWFRGDGSDAFIALSLIDESYTRRYAALLALKSAEWRRVALRWEDFVPELVSADWLGAPGARMKPSEVRALWFGRWHYFKPWSACAFELDELRLEARLERPAPPGTPEPGLTRTRARLAKKEPVTLVALGDSITFGTGLADRAREAWPARLQELLRAKFGYDGIRVLNRGSGGQETRQAIVLLPRDVAPDEPDLVLFHFGYNDYSTMLEKRMAEPACRAVAAADARELIGRIRRVTAGHADVLAMATLPGLDESRRHGMDFFGDEYRLAAEAAGCAFTPGPRAAFHAALDAGNLAELFARSADGRMDPAHPNERGQRIIAEALLKAFE